MPVTVAQWIVAIAALYLIAGIAVAIPFVTRAITRVDPATTGSSPLFRALILPGVVALWPLMLRRWLGARDPSQGHAP